MSALGSPPPICILGGTGFVGRHLAARLARAGQAVRIPTRNPARSRDLLVLPGVSLVRTDVHDPDQLRAACAGARAVVNLVAILNERGRDGRGFEHVHVELVRKLLDACRRLGVSRLLHMSALRADPAGPSHYLRTKGEAERLLGGEHGIAVTIFRPSVIFGPGDAFISRFARLLRMPSPVFPLPRADARFAPVHVRDVVEACARALDDRQTAGESYELCGPRVYALREIVGLIAAAVGRRRHVASVPDALARLQARVMDYLPGKPFSTDNFLSLTVDSVCQRDGFARLGIVPASLEPVLRQQFGAGAEQARYDRHRRFAGR